MSQNNSVIEVVTDKEKFAKKLGASIRAIREGKKISLKEFEAIDPSIDRHQMSRIESGKVVPSSFTVHRIATTLGVRTSDIFENVK
ncbi:MAG: helix-turn-helix transcriptional regulator [Cytophagales bacterium]|nr:helix-turn-helix transcriptional regulator [Cytophagales bacterium]